jgi:hypothetical protein
MTDHENHLEILESQFPAASGSAFEAARKVVLASGQSVLQSEEGCVYEVFPDGRKVFVKRIEPPIKVELGSKWSLHSGVVQAVSPG